MTHKTHLISFAVVLVTVIPGCKLERIPTDDPLADIKDLAAPDIASAADMAPDPECKVDETDGFCAVKCGKDIATNFNHDYCIYSRHHSWLQISMTDVRDGKTGLPMDRGCPCMLVLERKNAAAGAPPMIETRFQYEFSYRYNRSGNYNHINYTDKDEISIFAWDEATSDGEEVMFNYSGLSPKSGSGSFRTNASVMGDKNRRRLFFNVFNNYNEGFKPTDCISSNCRRPAYWRLEKLIIRDGDLMKDFGG